MIKIKGPITFKGGIPISEQIQKKIDESVAKGEIEMKVPFTATGWKSTKNEDKVNK